MVQGSNLSCLGAYAFHLDVLGPRANQTPKTLGSTANTRTSDQRDTSLSVCVFVAALICRGSRCLLTLVRRVYSLWWNSIICMEKLLQLLEPFLILRMPQFSLFPSSLLYA